MTILRPAAGYLNSSTETKFDVQTKEISMSFADKAVVVTGGASGIGLATAHHGIDFSVVEPGPLQNGAS